MIRWVREAVRRWLKQLGVRLRPLNATERLGREGERAACRHLRKQGYVVLGRNLRVPMGEADIVCRGPDMETVVLVEVKARRVGAEVSELQRAAEAAVDEEKRQTLKAIMRHLTKHNSWWKRPRRIDVVAVDFDELGRVRELRHHEGCVR